MKQFNSTELSLCKKFLQTARILILDDEIGGRLALKNSLLSFDITPQNITLVSSIKQAEIEIEKNPPQIIFSEYLLGDGFCMPLRDLKSNMIFILATHENSRAMLAHVAEAGLDCFLFKPYERKALKHALFHSVLKHINPSESLKHIELGKVNLRIGLAEQALSAFQEAKRLNPNLPQVYALIATSLLELGTPPKDVEEVYYEGLSHSPDNFECLFGLYHLFKNTGRIQESYAYVKKIVLHYPEDPARLVEAIVLAMKSKNYQDLEIYYRIFGQIYSTSLSLETALASALSVKGFYHLNHHEKHRAIACFQKVLEITTNKVKFVDYVYTKLNDAGFPSDANDFQELFRGPDPASEKPSSRVS